MVSSAALQVSLVLVVGTEAGKPVSNKRGLGAYTGVGSNWTCQDGAYLGLESSWHYTWVANPSQYNRCKGQNISAEFVPMVNGINQTTKMLGTDHYIKEWTEHNVHYLLGYNEPDAGNGKAHQHPHRCTPAEAAKDWPGLQQLAALFDPPLELVAPAVSSVSESGGTDAWDDNGHSQWLTDFFNNCTEVVADCDPSSIKYIAMHDYHGDVKQLQKRVSGARHHYGGRKVWLTEFAHTQYGAAPTREEENAYLTEVLPYLDGSDDVFRYAWYSTRNAPNAQNGGSNLLETDGSARLTSTGRIYSGQSSDTVMV